MGKPAQHNKKIVHKNKASRHTRRLSMAVKSMAA
jgi:ribosomal protein S20